MSLPSVTLYEFLYEFASKGKSYYFSLAKAGEYSQVYFRAALRRKWIAYAPGKGFHVTSEGFADYEYCNARSILRSETMIGRPLTSYFDPNVYGLKATEKPERKKGQGRATNVREFKRRMAS